MAAATTTTTTGILFCLGVCGAQPSTTLMAYMCGQRARPTHIEHTGFMFCCGRRTLPNHPSRFPAVWLGGKYVYCVWPGRIATATPTTTTTTANTALGARSHLTVCFQHKDHRRRYNNDKSGMEVGGGAGGMYVRKGYGKVGGRTHNG